MKIKYELLRSNIFTPYKAHDNDAGYDLCMNSDGTLKAHQTTTIGLGITLDIPKGFMGLLLPRSSTAKRGIEVAGPPIDAGYTGEIRAILCNTTREDFCYVEQTRLVQLVLVPVVLFEMVKEYPKNVRDAKGFGDSGGHYDTK